MYVQATVFEKMINIPNSPQIRWQGIGDDAGYSIIEGNLDGQGSSYFISNQLAGIITGTITFGNNTLNFDTAPLRPYYHFPKVEWLNGQWWATHLPNSAMEWTFIHTPIQGWIPRSWRWYDQDHQGTEDPGEISSNYPYGDEWFEVTSSGFFLRGEYNRLTLSGAISVSVNWTYSWENLWKHSGGGTAPAGEYTKVGDNSNKRTVGYWNEDNSQYEINPEDEGTAKMFTIGLLQVPNYNTTSLPIGWGFSGADWSNPDPLDWRYWYCIRAAMLERESLLYVTEHRRMGTLFTGAETIFDLSPLSPPTLAAIGMYRSYLKTLAGHFIDYSKAYKCIRNREYSPHSQYTDHSAWMNLDGYEYLGGGWEHGDTPESETLGDLSEWLKEAKDALEKMVITEIPIDTYARIRRVDGWAYGDPEDKSWSEIYSDALSDAEDDPLATWSYRTDGGYMGWSNCQSDVYIRCSTRYDWDQSEETWYEASVDKNDMETIDINTPNTSVIDGQIMAKPQLLWIRESHSGYEGVEIGDNWYGEEVTEVGYWADGISEGVTAGTARLPFDCSQDFPSSMSPAPHPPEESSWWGGCSLHGNETTWWLFCFWGSVFKFTGPLPDPTSQDEGGQSPSPSPSPQPQAIAGPMFEQNFDGYDPIKDSKSDDPGPEIKYRSTSKRSPSNLSYTASAHSWAVERIWPTFVDEKGKERPDMLKDPEVRLKRYLKAKVFQKKKEYCLVPCGTLLDEPSHMSYRTWLYSDKPPEVRLGSNGQVYYHWKDCIPGKAKVLKDTEWKNPNPDFW